MRFSMLLAGLAVLTVVPAPARADSQSDLEQCKLIGGLDRVDQSIAACDRVIADSGVAGSRRAAAFSNRCGWWWARQQLERALPDCDAAIRIDPDAPAAYINRGNVYLGKGDKARALGDYDEAVRRDPKSAWAYNSRGNFYRNNNDPDPALADFDAAIRLDPYYALAYFDRGAVYKSRNEFARALADLNESLRLDPNNAQAYFNRGSVSYSMGDNARAIADYTAAIRFDPAYAAAYLNRGVAYFFVGRSVADAEADFRKANELDSKNAYAALWLELAERRNKAPSRLAQTARHLDMTAWPAPVIRQFLGELSSAQTLAAAADSDPKATQGQTCEAAFYGGEWALLKDRRQDAQRLFRLAASSCPQGFIEATAAIAELVLKY
ncbi:tetratricopeptide repeat protein [Bradyrhizobium prioriisuperbiae]|uniref:tetratricopeptide repeat protein n=1 Tax=Bradyrhizobium prioriisuperbiae TaxID=2854389 RepID=UPI0028EC0126|nr:tetratricopeptide repeat protein [Bradyrhizobium prioritasuperba]